ncbi:hypothetical protein OMP38_26925 [Cohnella ginsengisoli]|uniref:Uncharacterized protein n=1 Tax=Cohnella ginsengisoli TaxID=425004 RepID=A0A9X4KKQ0_9BACL|nr:hypothetical protein [Cohnella ginsengisoli]MDG0794054.1 hypothetical protein [Cohnella ginsengisoli]
MRHGRFKIQSLLFGLPAFTLIGSTVTLTRTTLQKNFEAARNLAISANTIKSLMFKSHENAAQYFNEERLSAGADSARMLDVLLLGSGLFNGAMMVAAMAKCSSRRGDRASRSAIAWMPRRWH